MARRRYIAWNGHTAALTAPFSSVTTGTSTKTMMQLKFGNDVAILGWGYSFDAVPTALVQCELLTSGTVAATVTALSSGDIANWDDSGTATSAATLSTSGSGFTSTAEGSITATRLFDYRHEWGQSYSVQFPLDREPGCIAANDILRVRMTTATAINAVCWVAWEE